MVADPVATNAAALTGLAHAAFAAINDPSPRSLEDVAAAHALARANMLRINAFMEAMQVWQLNGQAGPMPVLSDG